MQQVVEKTENIDKSVIEQALFSLIRFEINETDICDAVKNSITKETLPLLYKISKIHDLAHLIGDALDKNGLLNANADYKNKFLWERNLALFRYEQMNYECEKICQTLEENQIKFTLLKGAVLKKLYPMPWLRTSSDIDILIDKSGIDKTQEVFTKTLDCTFEKECENTYSAHTKSGVHVEVHLDLSRDFKSGEIIDNVDNFLQDYSGNYCKVLQNEIFYVHLLAHMAKHIIHGGCGVRAFLDIWIFNSKVSINREKLSKILNEYNLVKLENACYNLSKVWFENATHDDLTKTLEEFILHGGIYGNIENQVAVNKAKTDGKSSGLAKKIFLPYDQLKFTYPVLQKHKWLTPFFEVVRWFRIVFKGRSKILAKELKANKKITKTQAEKTANLLKDLGL